MSVHSRKHNYIQRTGRVSVWGAWSRALRLPLPHSRNLRASEDLLRVSDFAAADRQGWWGLPGSTPGWCPGLGSCCSARLGFWVAVLLQPNQKESSFWKICGSQNSLPPSQSLHISALYILPSVVRNF